MYKYIFIYIFEHHTKSRERELRKKQSKRKNNTTYVDRYIFLGRNRVCRNAVARLKRSATIATNRLGIDGYNRESFIESTTDESQVLTARPSCHDIDTRETF